MIITRYLSKQVLQNTAAISFILLVVAVLGKLLRYLALASRGELDPGVLFLLMSYRLPDFLQLILPLALLLGILLAYGRMYAESEMTVLIACGLSATRMLMITLASAGLVTVVTAGMALYLTPKGMTSAANLLEAQENLNEFDVMVPGLFQNISHGERITYAEKIENRTMLNVFMVESEKNRVIAADSAATIEDADGNRFVLFRNGSVTEGITETEGFSLTSFNEMGIRLPPRNINFEATLQEQAMSSEELWQGGQPAQIAELQWRISLVLLVPILTLMAVPLSRVSPREGRFVRLVPAILIYIAYFGLLLFSRDQLAKAALPAWLGLWWVHVVFMATGWGLFSGLFSTALLKRIKWAPHAKN